MPMFRNIVAQNKVICIIVKCSHEVTVHLLANSDVNVNLQKGVILGRYIKREGYHFPVGTDSYASSDRSIQFYTKCHA